MLRNKLLELYHGIDAKLDVSIDPTERETNDTIS